MPHIFAPLPRRRAGMLTAGLLFALTSGLLIAPAVPASAAPAALAEGFDSAALDTPPTGWSVEHRNIAGMQAGWGGWTFQTTAEVVAKFGGGGDRGSFGRGQGLVAVVQSDSNRPSSGTFDSTLWSPQTALSGDASAVSIGFDSHYKPGQTPQSAKLVAKFDGAAPVQVGAFSSVRLNEAASYTVDVPAGAQNVQFGWSYLQSSNNWFWMIDNISVAEAAPVDVTPTVLSARKPVVSPGASTTVQVGGLRAGQQLVATLGDPVAGTPVAGIPAAAADGTVSFEVVVSADQQPGTLPLHLSGTGIMPVSLAITVLTAEHEGGTTTEPQLWFDGFEGTPSEWQGGEGGWQFSTRDAVVAAYGTDRRHAFTRASGTIAAAEASKAAFADTLTSAPIAVTGGDALELRLDSHFRKRAADIRGTVTAVFDSGERAQLHELTSDEESAQLRLAFAVPAGASSVRFELSLTAAAGAGSWMIDDVQLVRPLSPLAEGAEASALVDVFSDVQGANARLGDQVLPGLRAMEPQASVLVSNGDLTSNGTPAQYDSYFAAYGKGGGGDYPTQISTIGNHEFYGANGSQTYIDRFLDRTSMRDVGGEGGLWGEVVVDGELPLLWIGSEHHNYPAQTGSGPFVEMSDKQFWWLSERLAHYRELGKPVLLFSHHVFANSVSGTYINFYKNEFGADQARVEALLSDNPNVVLMSSHTHWSPKLNDWSVEQRFDPASALAPTIINTAAVTTMYGPSGDWGETGIGGADPVGMRAALYDDRVRVTAYSFGAGGTTTEIRHIDVPLPAESPVQPEVPAEITLGETSTRAGAEVTITGSGFATSEQLRFELRSTPTPLGEGAADAAGALSTTVTIPADTEPGEHQLVAIRADGSEIAASLTVLAAEVPGEGGTDGSGSAGSGAEGSAASSGAGSGQTGTGAAGSGLAATGAELPAIAVALALILGAAGALIFWRGQRARRAEAAQSDGS